MSLFNKVKTLKPAIRVCSYSVNSNTSTTSKSNVYALSSGAGKAGVAVIRVSGPESAQVVHRMTNLKEIPQSRVATLTKLNDVQTGEFLDKGIVLFFKGPRSFTGEDSCELHVHGGVAVVASILNSLSKMPNFRLAQPGEFTRRAFLNGKLDLTAVEGLADLIAAETEAQRRQALRQMDGDLHRLYLGWRNRIVKLAAYVEAVIDFSEDENIDDGLMNTVEKEAGVLLEDVERHLSDNRRGERLRSGVHVVIVGEPNVGKSSLLNIISQRPAAIVSPFAGTTRDVVECHVNIGGYPVLLSDTAGLRQSQDEIEKEGMKRALDRARMADLVVVMMEPENLTGVAENKRDVDDVMKTLIEDLGLSEMLKTEDATTTKKTMVVVNKMDTCQQNFIEHRNQFHTHNCVMISCKTGHGIDELMQRLKAHVEELCVCGDAAEIPTLTQQRHRTHLNHCVDRLKAFFEAKDKDLAIAAHHLRKGGDHLGKISGEFTTEDLLDIIFKEFCIGK